MTEKNRASNIELLRIITIFGVVILHYNGNVAFSYVAEGSANFCILYALEALFICAVNLFVLICGFFSSRTQKRRTVKMLELLVQVVLIGILKYLLTCVMGGQSFSVRSIVGAMIPNNYFVALYITLYIISPYINLALSKLEDRQYRILVAVVVCLFSVWPTVLDMVGVVTGYVFNGMYTTNSAGSQYGYSLLNFVMMYLIGGLLARDAGDNRRSGKTHWLAVMLAGCVGVLTLWQLYYPQIARSYCNPLVVLEAVLIFLLFRKFSFSSKMVNSLAKGAFTCFLMHDWFLWYIGIEKAVTASPLRMILHILITVPLIFAASWGIWKLYDWVTRPVFKWLGRKISGLDRLISLEK